MSEEDNVVENEEPTQPEPEVEPTPEPVAEEPAPTQEAPKGNRVRDLSFR